MPVTEEDLKGRLGKIEAGKLYPQILITIAGIFIIFK